MTSRRAKGKQDVVDDFEALRQEKIAQNKAHLNALALAEALDTVHQQQQARKRRPPSRQQHGPPPKVEVPDLKRSRRLAREKPLHYDLLEKGQVAFPRKLKPVKLPAQPAGHLSASVQVQRLNIQRVREMSDEQQAKRISKITNLAKLNDLIALLNANDKVDLSTLAQQRLADLTGTEA